MNTYHCKCAICGDWYAREELYYFGIDDDETGCHDVFKCGDCLELDPPVIWESRAQRAERSVL